MAIENALIAKIVGSITVLGGASSAGVVYRNEIINKFQDIFGKKSTDDYLLLVAKTSSSSTQPSDEININNIKNYKCTSGVGETKEDRTCEIYKLPTKNDNNLNGISDINVDLKNTPNKSDVSTLGNYFKLKVKKTLFPNLKLDGTETVSLISTTDNTNKTYGVFSIVYKIEGNKFFGKTNLLIAKVKANVTEDISSGTLQCKFSNENDSALKNCTIYKFETQTDNLQEYKKLSFQTSNITATTNKADIKTSKFVIIKLKDEKFLNTELANNTTVVCIKKTETNGTSTTQEVGNFDLITGLAKVSEFPTSLNTFFLNNN